MSSKYIPSGVLLDRYQTRSSSGFTNYLMATVPLNNGRLNLTHSLLESSYDFDVMSAYANFYGSFWKGSPARRGVLLLKPAAAPEPFTERDQCLIAPIADGIRYIERNAAESAALSEETVKGSLRFSDGRLVDHRPEYNETFLNICKERRAIFFPAGNRDLRTGNDGLDRVGIVVPLGRYGDRLSRRSTNSLAFNSGYFVWTDEEFRADPASRVPDPVGLTMEDGTVSTPAIYKRPALLWGWDPRDSQIRSLSIHDFVVYVGEVEVPGSEVMTRASIKSRGLSSIPNAHRRLVIVRDTVVGEVVDAAVAHPPGGGFFVDIPYQNAASVLRASTPVRYESALLAKTRTACQGSIELIRHGKLVDLAFESARLDLPLRGGVLGEVPPNHLTPPALLAGGLARTAVGILPNQTLLVVHAEGSERRSRDSRFDSEGTTLSELALVLANKGCQSAMAFDGGGSAAMAAGGELLITPADRFDVCHLPRERVIPGGWFISASGD